jgi:hypothetical protein
MTQRGFFEPSLAGVNAMLDRQLELAESKQLRRVQIVILTGGFGQSPSLRSYIQAYLNGCKNIKDWEIDLVVPQSP